jgi:tetratricopeptide (TPR) repeat protein
MPPTPSNFAQTGLYVPSVKAIPAATPTVAPVPLPLAMEYFLRGQQKMNENKFIAAKLDFDNAIALDPTMGDAYLLGAESLLEMGDATTAYYYVNQGVKHNSNPFKTNFLQGLALLKMGKSKDAIEYLNQAIKLNPQYAQSYAEVALAYSEQQDNILAERNYKIALHLEPKNGNWHYRLGQLLEREGKREEAIQELGLAIENNSDFKQRALELIERN